MFSYCLSKLEVQYWQFVPQKIYLELEIFFVNCDENIKITRINTYKYTYYFWVTNVINEKQSSDDHCMIRYVIDSKFDFELRLLIVIHQMLYLNSRWHIVTTILIFRYVRYVYHLFTFNSRPHIVSATWVFVSNLLFLDWLWISCRSLSGVLWTCRELVCAVKTVV